jgi:hypothetical protein
MASVVEENGHAIPIGRIIARGFVAANGALVGALYLFFLHAPGQVLVPVAQRTQWGAVAGAGQPPDASQLLLSLSLSCGALVLALAVFFVFPLVQGGILGQVRDGLESPPRFPGQFGAYGRTFYVRLLGSQALFALVLIALMLPAMCLGVGLAYQEMAKVIEDMGKATPTEPTAGTPAQQPPDPQELNWHFMSHPMMLAGMVIASFLGSIVSLIYWVANSIVVAEDRRVMASWRSSLRFCRENVSAVVAVWLLSFAAGLLIAPFGVVGQFGIVKDLRAVVALALVYSALIGYWGVLLAGLTMSLYLGRRTPPTRQPGPAEGDPAALAGAR